MCSFAESNAEECYNKIALMSKVCRNHNLFHEHLLSKEYVKALDTFSISRKLLAEHFSGVVCFSHIESEITERQRIIGALMQEDYSKFLTNEWHRPVEDHSKVKKLNEEDTLATIICALLYLDNFNFMEKFKEEACAAVRSTTKQTLIEVFAPRDHIDISDRSEEAMFLKTLELDHGTWIELLKKLFENFCNLLRRIRQVHNVVQTAIGKCSNSLKNDDHMINASSVTAVNDNSQNCLNEICDFTHERCAKLIEKKVSDGSFARLTTSEFTQFSSAIQIFIIKCENICGRRSTHLQRFTVRLPAGNS